MGSGGQKEGAAASVLPWTPSQERRLPQQPLSASQAGAQPPSSGLSVEPW